MPSIRKDLQAVARRVMREGLLRQFLPAKEQIDWIDGKRKKNGSDQEDESIKEEALKRERKE